jgi:hypothetical protein
MELYGIISIIDDEHFGGENAFRAQYAGSGASSAALDVLRDRLKPICHRSLRRQVQEAGHISFTKRNAKTFISIRRSRNEISMSSYLLF